ncbi:hypothetical protein OG474_24660 [Kribbella sp. NBC_01505]|uniref:hypothetical protein n=1 Tax=Kribbella sp. NBC_01505 TaxID=2903580 RepID=UPI00386A987E
MKRLSVVLALVVLVTGCGGKDFTAPTDGSTRISQGTVGSFGDGVGIGVGGVLKDPDRAMLSVQKTGMDSVQLTLKVGEQGTAFGRTVSVSAVEFGDHDYAWVKVG